MDSDIKIKCPHCGFEYMPAEIYYPDSFLGKPMDISRDDSGKIDFYTGHNMDLNEEFECPNCGCHFEINCKVDFSTTVISLSDSNETVYKINK
jgi:predicted RNA-binding Zn-ribbon protein involved in translation (DUF1610 family)